MYLSVLSNHLACGLGSVTFAVGHHLVFTATAGTLFPTSTFLPSAFSVLRRKGQPVSTPPEDVVRQSASCRHFHPCALPFLLRSWSSLRRAPCFPYGSSWTWSASLESVFDFLLHDAGAPAEGELSRTALDLRCVLPSVTWLLLSSRGH